MEPKMLKVAGHMMATLDVKPSPDGVRTTHVAFTD